MRTEVKIGILVCLVLAGLVAVYFAVWPKSPEPAAAPPGGGDRSQTSASPPPATRPARVAITPPPSPGLPSPSATPPGLLRPPGEPLTTRPFAATPATPALVSPPPAPVPVAAPPAPVATPPVPVATPLQPPVGPGLLAPAPTGPPAPKSPYIVVADDKGFYGIAKKVYGDSKYLYLIAKANPTVQSERLTPGMKLTIPPLPPEAVAAAAAGLRPGTPAPPPGGEGAYVVKEGETLWSIAEKQYGDGIYFVRIAEANPTMGDPQKLRPGQKLVIPKLTVASGMTATRPAQPAKVLSPGQKSYKVVQGDLLWDIAVREYGDGSLYPVIVEANPGLVDPNHLPVGKEIIIPSRSHAEAIVRKPAAGTAARTGETATARPPAPSADKGYVPGKPYWD